MSRIGHDRVPNYVVSSLIVSLCWFMRVTFWVNTWQGFLCISRLGVCVVLFCIHNEQVFSSIQGTQHEYLLRAWRIAGIGF